MRRYRESSERDYEHAIHLGKDNARCIAELRRWCKHFRIKQQSGGLYAEMSGLPIGLHEMECPHVEGSFYSSNIRALCTEFLFENCNGCPHHEPNGDAAWGRQIIAQQEERRRAREAEVARRQTEITRLRAELRAESQEIGQHVETESSRIVAYLEDVFSDDDVTRRSAADNLVQAARVGADLFPDAAVTLLLSQTLDEHFARPAFAIVAELAAQRTDLAARIELSALGAIQDGPDPHAAGSVIARLGERAHYPLDPACIERLLVSQCHEIPIGGWHGEEPDYTDSTTLLARSLDADSASVLGPVRQQLGHERDAVRIAVVGALILLQSQRPGVVSALLPDLLASLNLVEEERMGSSTPSGMIVRLLKAGFRHAPSPMDVALREAMQHARPAVQEDVVDVYRGQFFDRNHGDEVEQTSAASPQRIAIQTLLTWMQDEGLEPDTRHQVVESLKHAAADFSELLLPELDTLLGYYALLCERDNPPPAPLRIVLPGESEDPALERLTEMNRRQHWKFFKQAVTSCLEELCEKRPSDAFPAVYGCLHQPTAPLSDAFRGTLVALVGRMGAAFSLQQRALPLVMRELMNYDSGVVRARAIDAVDEMFTSDLPPPGNIVDTILVHLQDPLFGVHQAAVRVVDRNASWFSEEQAVTVLNSLAAHAVAYASDPFQLERICKAAFRVARSQPRWTGTALAIAERVFPTKQDLVDHDIALAMTRLIDPDHWLAPRAARHVANCLATYPRDRLGGSSNWDRDRILEWLHELPAQAFAAVSQYLLVFAKRIATASIWESWHFASLFSQHGRFADEREVLETARSSLPNEPRFDRTRTGISRMIAVAAANEALCRSDCDAAEGLFQDACEGE